MNEMRKFQVLSAMPFGKRMTCTQIHKGTGTRCRDTTLQAIRDLMDSGEVVTDGYVRTGALSVTAYRRLDVPQRPVRSESAEAITTNPFLWRSYVQPVPGRGDKWGSEKWR